jgi:diguanylate cyclase (GGDEF)-like protein
MAGITGPHFRDLDRMAPHSALADGTAGIDLQASPKTLARRAAQRRSTYLAQGVSYLIDGVILALYWHVGTTTLAVPVVYLICGMTTTAIMLGLSEIHFNDRFKDHYLTVPQNLLGMTVLLGAIYLAPEVGFYFIYILFIVLSFGALRMSARQTALVWTYSTVGLAVLLLVSDKAIAMPLSTWPERALLLACVVTALGRCASTGLYGSSMREALYKRGNELREAYARIEELAQLDELTGLLNRRTIMKCLDEELVRAQRGAAPCSVAIIDVDFFKKINDRFGHPVGDEALRAFAITLFANVRTIDRVGRYGGEEFVLVLPGIAKQQAVGTLDRLRRIIGELDWSAIAGDMTVTMSAGVCAVRPTDAVEDVLARADVALYRAKDTGRNRVVAA